MIKTSEGAEAKIYSSKAFAENFLIKNRESKRYRESALDLYLRKVRTKQEARAMIRAMRNGIKVPRLVAIGDFSLYMEKLNGKLLKDSKKSTTVLEKIGKELANMHKCNIVHGDFTPANVMLDKNEVYIIDFGLSSISDSIEDKALDLLLMKRSISNKQFSILEKSYVSSYTNANNVLHRLAAIELRGRYQTRTLS